MELISGFFFIVIIGVISYVFSKKDNPKENKIEELDSDKEMKIRNQILEQIDFFLSDASYHEHLGNWNKEKIYKYICNKGRVYEFEDFMSENNQRIGINEEQLCFKRMAYKRNDKAIIDIIVKA